MKVFTVGLFAFACSAALAAIDNVMVAAQEAESGGSLPGAALLFGAIGAAWLGWAGREDGNIIAGAAVGGAIGSMLGLMVSVLLR